MPSVILTPRAMADMQRLRDFLETKNAPAARRAGVVMVEAIKTLARYPGAGRVNTADPMLRELLIDYGDSGYIALYRIEGDTVSIVAMRHQKEAGY